MQKTRKRIPAASITNAKCRILLQKCDHLAFYNNVANRPWADVTATLGTNVHVPKKIYVAISHTAVDGGIHRYARDVFRGVLELYSKKSMCS